MTIFMLILLISGLAILLFEDSEPVTEPEDLKSFEWMLLGIALSTIGGMYFLWQLIKDFA